MTASNHGRPDEVNLSMEDERTLELVPPALQSYLRELAYLSPAAQGIALRTTGAGSRLVLDALGLVSPATGQLTDQGTTLANVLADETGSAAVLAFPARGGVHRIDRAIGAGALLRAVAKTVDEADEASTTYNLTLQDQDENAPPASVVAVRQIGRRLWIWQEAGVGTHTVVDLKTLAPLPDNSDEAATYRNTTGEAPSLLIRELLGLTEGHRERDL